MTSYQYYSGEYSSSKSLRSEVVDLIADQGETKLPSPSIYSPTHPFPVVTILGDGPYSNEGNLVSQTSISSLSCYREDLGQVEIPYSIHSTELKSIPPASTCSKFKEQSSTSSLLCGNSTPPSYSFLSRDAVGYPISPNASYEETHWVDTVPFLPELPKVSVDSNLSNETNTIHPSISNFPVSCEPNSIHNASSSTLDTLEGTSNIVMKTSPTSKLTTNLTPTLKSNESTNFSSVSSSRIVSASSVSHLNTSSTHAHTQLPGSGLVERIEGSLPSPPLNSSVTNSHKNDHHVEGMLFSKNVTLLSFSCLVVVVSDCFHFDNVWGFVQLLASFLHITLYFSLF
jgi:hypothetical protein